MSSSDSVGGRPFHVFATEELRDYVSVWNGRDSLSPVDPLPPVERREDEGAASMWYLTAAQKDVLAFLRAHPGAEFGPREIAAAVGRSEGGVKEAVLWLYRRGRYGLRRRRVAHERVYGGSWLRYWLT